MAVAVAVVVVGRLAAVVVVLHRQDLSTELLCVHFVLVLLLLLLLLMMLLVMLLSGRGHQELLRMWRLEKVLGPHDVMSRKRGKEGLGLKLVPERIAIFDGRWLCRPRWETWSTEEPSLVQHWAEVGPRRHEAVLVAGAEVRPLPGVAGMTFVMRMKGRKLTLESGSATVRTWLRQEHTSGVLV